MTKKTSEEINDIFKNYEDDNSGFEDMTSDAQAIPFVRILQALSPQVKKKKTEYVEGAEPGMVFNTINNKIYPTPLRFIVGKFERYYIEWKPNRGGFAGVHAVEAIEKRLGDDLIIDEKFMAFNPATGNEFAETYVYYVVFPDFVEDGVCIFSFSSSQLKEAKKLNRNLRSTMIPGTKKRALPYFTVWNFEVCEMSNDKGEWFGPRFTFDSFVTQEQLEYVSSERKELPNKSVNLALIEQDAGTKVTGDVKY